jgi:predicted phosphodiesterase
MSPKEADEYMPERKQGGIPPKEKIRKVPFSEAIQQILVNLKGSPICQSLPAIEVPSIKGNGDEEEVVVMLSDWQIGHKTRSFNADIAKARVEDLAKAILKIVAIHRQAYPIRKLRVLLAGDFIQSEKVGYLVDLSELECILLDQVFGYAVPLLSWFLAECAKNFEEINVHCVRGNHGRGEKGSSEKTNWDDVIYKVLETKFADVKHVKFHIAREFYQIFKVSDTRFLLAHGDQVRGGTYSIPLYALLQRMLRWATSMTEDWDVLCVGHWHCYGHIDQNNQELIVNGTLVSDDEYVRRQYGWSSSTLQVMFGVHPRKGITWEYRIKL